MKQPFSLRSQTIGALPIVNQFLHRLRFHRLLQRYLPPSHPRARITPAQTLGVLVRNLIICRTPLYSMGEWAQPLAPPMLALSPTQMTLLNDDRIGRALDHLFDADRQALLTDFVVGMVKTFKVKLDDVHNDSTTITLHGEYVHANGKPLRGKPTLTITYGHNKDHRPDLKQLLWILTISSDGAVPVHFKVADGQTEDSSTHIETWNILHKIVGNSKFIYVADSKLCTRANLRYIDERGGGFVTVLPRSRKEDTLFRDWIQCHKPEWKEVARYPHPRLKHGPDDVFRSLESPVPDTDGYRIIWFHSSHKLERDAESRQECIARAYARLAALQAKLQGPKCRLHTPRAVARAADRILTETGTENWIQYTVRTIRDESYRQEQGGRAGHETRYKKITRLRFRLEWILNRRAVRYHARTDGIFPLVTNRTQLAMREVLELYKSKHPFVEKRHHLLKNVQKATPAFLKNVGRLEALLLLLYISMTVNALIEREIRNSMAKHHLHRLPLYPEGRECKNPTANRIFDVFAHLQAHILSKGRTHIQTFQPELSPLQQKTLALLNVSPAQFHHTC